MKRLQRGITKSVQSTYHMIDFCASKSYSRKYFVFCLSQHRESEVHMARAGLEEHIRGLTDQLRGAEAEINELTGHLKDGDNLHAKLKEDARLAAEEIRNAREEAYDKQKLLETQVREIFLCGE